ncbi:MAG TPA: TetR/AcrR family transcriptional regulator [Gemmatimonadales bacterium]|nr:TetR/AcrR family transcriptional regulator [Gemmatimonadales bacterium]
MAHASFTHQRLARAALELFTTQGYHPTTTPQIAKRAGVAEGTIYRHFPSKRALLNDLYRGAARWAAKLAKEAAAKGGPPRRVLADLGRDLVAGAAREPAVVRLFFLQAHGVDVDEESRHAGREFRGALETLVAQGKADGSVKPGAAELWATIWLGVVGLALDRVAARDWAPDHANVATTLEAAWDAIAIASPSSAAAVSPPGAA